MSKLAILKLIAENIHNIEAGAKLVSKVKPVIDNISTKLDSEIDNIVSTKTDDVSWSTHIANKLSEKLTSNNEEETTERMTDDIRDMIAARVKEDSLIVGNENGKFFVKFYVSDDELKKLVK